MLQSVCSCENLATFSLFRVLWDIITGSCFTHHVLICVDTFLSLSSSEFFLGVLERMPLINPLLRSIKFCNPLSLQELMYIFIVLGFVGGIIIGCSFTYQVLRCVDMWWYACIFVFKQVLGFWSRFRSHQPSKICNPLFLETLGIFLGFCGWRRLETQ